MDPVWWAWAAGLLEGDGSFIAASGRDAGCVVCRLSDRDVLVRLRVVLAAGSVTGPYHLAPPRKPRWVWKTCRREDVLWMCRVVRPFMGARRRIQIDALIRSLGESASRETEESNQVWERVRGYGSDR